MTNELVIGIDSSTSGCKAGAWDTQGRLVALTQRPHRLLQPQPGWYEQDAAGWWQAMCAALRELSARVDSSRLVGLSIAHQRETFVPTDSAGAPIRNAILWLDERARSLLPSLEHVCGRDAFHKTTGKPLSGNLTYTKIAWLREHEPDTFSRSHLFMDVQSFLVHCLTGEALTGWGSADPTGLFDMHVNQWADDLLAHIGITARQLPPARPPGSRLGVVSRAAAGQTGMPAGLPVIAGLGDGQAGGLGAGIVQPGSAYLSLGSSVIGGTFSPAYVISPAFRTMTGGIPGSCSLETVILGGACTIDWLLAKFCAHSSLDEMENAAGLIASGCDGLLLVPYWNSAMNPYWDAEASGIVVGWRSHHTPAHLYRAILEGIAFEVRLQLEGVEQALGQPVERLAVMGGGARSRLWRGIIADVSGRRLQRSTAAEAAALGAAILAAASCGLHPSIASAAQQMAGLDEETLHPDPVRYDHYTELFNNVYRRLFPALQQPLQQLTRLSDPPPYL